MNLIITLLMSQAATAALLWGPITSGGGDAITCYNSQEELISAELLDLYEGRTVFNDGFQELEGTAQDISLKIMSELKKTAYGVIAPPNQLERIHSNLLAKMRIIPSTQRLEDIPDSLHVAIPKNCRIEQAAAYLDDDNILFDGRIWEAMTSTHRAALLVHESLYRIDRAYKVSHDSRQIRRTVSKLFDPNRVVPDLLGELKDGYICRSITREADPSYSPGNTVFYVNEKTDGWVELKFLALGGDLFTSEIEPTFLPGHPFRSSDYQNGEARSFQLRVGSKDQGTYQVKLDIVNQPLTKKVSHLNISMDISRSSWPREKLQSVSILCQN